MYDVTRQFQITLLELIARNENKLRLAKVTLGGSSGSVGGSGTPPGGYDGQIAQRYIAYDTTEAIVSGSVGGSGSIPSLVDNLNRIRGNVFVFNNSTLPANISATSAYGTRAYASRDDHVHSVPLGNNMSWTSGSLTASVTGGTVSGSGTANALAVWSDANTLTKIATPASALYILQTGVSGPPVWSFNTLNLSGPSALNGSFVGNLTGSGTVATNGFTLTVPASGSAVLGNGVQYQLAIWNSTHVVAGLGSLGTANSVLQSAGAGAIPTWSGWYLLGAAAQTYSFPNSSGSVPLGTGATNTLAKWSGTNTLTNIDNAAGFLSNNGTGTFSYVDSSTYVTQTGTVTGGRVAVWLAPEQIQDSLLAVSGSSVLTLETNTTSTLTVPGTGTVALLGTANHFIAIQTITSTTNNSYDGLVLKPLNESQSLSLGWNGISATYSLLLGNTSNQPIVFSQNSTEVGRIPSTNLKWGGTAVRATTEGTKHIDIFDGTAPVGTLANGCSIFSDTGELWTMDSAGNKTQQTPHDKQKRWIFNSENTVTGYKLAIDVELMLRALNDKFGWNYIHEGVNT